MAILSRNFHLMNAFNFFDTFSKDKLYIAIGNPNAWSGPNIDEINPPTASVGNYISKEDIIAIAPILSYNLVYPVSGADLNATDNYVSYADQLYRRLDNLPDGTTIENINDRIDNNIYPHYVYADFIFGYNEINELFSNAFASYAYPWKITWSTDVNTDNDTDTDDKVIINPNYTYSITLGFTTLNRDTAGKIAASPVSYFTLRVVCLHTKEEVLLKQFAVNNETTFSSLASRMNSAQSVLTFTEHTTDAASGIPYYATLSDFTFYNNVEEYNYYFSTPLINMEVAKAYTLNNSGATAPDCSFYFPWKSTWKSGSNHSTSKTHTLKIGYSKADKTEAKWLITEGGVNFESGTITSSTVLSISDITTQITAKSTKITLTEKCPPVGIKYKDVRKCEPIYLQGFATYEHPGHDGTLDYARYYDTAISGMTQAVTVTIDKTSEYTSYSNAIAFPWNISWVTSKRPASDDGYTYHLKIGYTAANKKTIKYILYTKDSSGTTKTKEGKELSSSTALNAKTIATLISLNSAYINLEYKEDTSSVINTPTTYRSAVLLYDPTFVSGSTKVNNIYRQRDIVNLGTQLCLDYFKPIYRDSTKTEKVAYLLQF